MRKRNLLIPGLLGLALLAATGEAAGLSKPLVEEAKDIEEMTSAVHKEASGVRMSLGVDGSIVYAASCSQEHVQAAIDAASDGDFVVVPAGDCTWSIPVDFYKSLTIQGAGIDATVITDDTPGSTWRQAPFWIQGSTGIYVRITGFTFKDLDKPDSFGVVNIRGDNNTFRIDHIKFDDINVRSIMISGKSYGVIDHCEFIQPGGQGIWIGDSRGSPAGST